MPTYVCFNPVITLTHEATCFAISFSERGHIHQVWLLEALDPVRWDMGKNMFLDTWGPILPGFSTDDLARIWALRPNKTKV